MALAAHQQCVVELGGRCSLSRLMSTASGGPEHLWHKCEKDHLAAVPGHAGGEQAMFQ
jgi:hypothetical protein